MNIVSIPKKNGKFRTIYVPNDDEKGTIKSFLPSLHDIQNSICRHAYGFIQHRNAVLAAKKHISYNYTICWDIKDFFDSVTTDLLVKHSDLFGENTEGGFSLLFANILQHCVVDGATRQGLPTSPIIANIVTSKLDQIIFTEIKEFGVYTRYADDLTISFNDESLIKILLKKIPEIVSEFGFTINKSKTRVQFSNRRRIICGVAIDSSGVHPTRSSRRKLRVLEHVASKPTRDRESFQEKVRGLKEWHRMRVPVGSIILESNNNRGHGILNSIDVINERSNRRLLREIVSKFPTKEFVKIKKFLSSSEESYKTNGKSLDYIATAVAATFGYRWRDWVKGNNVHDCTYWLSPINHPNNGLGDFLFKIRREIPNLLGSSTEGPENRLSDLEIVSKSWSLFTEYEKTLSLNKLVDLCSIKTFKNVKVEEFALYASKAGASNKDFNSYQRKWINGLNEIKQINIPHVYLKKEIDGVKYEICNVDKRDPIVPWIGLFTGCCQHLESQADDSAWHSALSPDGALIVVKRDGEIIAQSWVWRNGNVVVADNCEAIESRDAEFQLLYSMWANAIIGKLMVKEVRIGSNSDFNTSIWPQVESVKAPNCYSDALSQVRIK